MKKVLKANPVKDHRTTIEEALRALLSMHLGNMVRRKVKEVLKKANVLTW